METAEADEKFARIRQTIRQTILPLVQSIYDEDPPDIELFCYEFFKGQLQKREIKEKDDVDGHFKNTEAFHDKKEKGKFIQKREDGDDKIVNAPTNIQGSASDPVLTGQKSHGVSLKETSSWDITPSHSKFDGRRADLISSLSDAKCGIGDQPCLEKPSDANPEIDGKSGDEYFFPKREDDILYENENIVPSDETVPVSDVLPSAPPFEDGLEKIKIEYDSFEISDQEVEVVYEKNLIAENETSLNSYCVINDATCSYSDECTDEKGLKTRSKPLSPNSSFGFVPHLNETCVKQEFDGPKSPKDSDFEKGIAVGNFDLASQFSETLQNLAQKFDSAESNLDVEFQKAKEISDVVHGRSLRANFKEEGNLNFNEAKEDSSTYETNYKSGEIESYIDVEENDDISICEAQKMEKSPIISYVEEPEEDLEIEQHEKSELREIQAEAADMDINEDGPELHEMIKCSFLQQENLNDDKNGTKVVNSTEIIDEEWRKKWYEAHTCLDTSSNRLGQTSTRVNIESQVYVSAHANLTTKPFGEAGDVPPELFRHNLTRNLRHLESNSRVERHVSFSPILEEHHPQENIPVDEMQRRESKKVAFSNLGKDVTRAKTSSSYSSNVPYAWRNRNKHQARRLETEKQALKQLLESCGEGAANENKPIGNLKSTHNQALHDSLSEKNDEKQASKSIYDNEENNESEADRNYELQEREGKIYEQNFKDNTHKKLQSPPLVKNDLFKADKQEGINIYVSNIADQSVKNLKTLTEDDCDVFETKEAPYHEEIKKTIPDNQNDLQEDKYFDTYCKREKDNVLFEKDETENGDVYENKTPGLVRYGDIKSEVKDAILAYQRMDNASKSEPGLDSAGGDFTSYNNENEGLLNNPESSEHESGPGLQEVTAEYVGEIIDRVVQQNFLNDSFEGLNLPSYLDDDSSDTESAYSDAEESNLYTEMCEQ